MKPETKIKILLSFLIPFLVIISGYAVLAIAETWNNKFATKEFVSIHFVTKEHANKYFMSKTDGAVIKQTIKDIYGQQKLIRNDIGEIRADFRELLTISKLMNNKINRQLLIDEAVAKSLKEPPKKPEPPPTAIVGNIK